MVKVHVDNGDIIVPHSCYNCGSECDSVCAPHNGVYIGSSRIIINGRMAQKMGDPISCTAIAIQGSPTVIIN